MQQKNQFPNFFEGMQTSLEDMMEAGRKNFQAMTEANQRTMQGWQKMAARQAEMATQFMQDNSTLAREAMSVQEPEGKLAKQTELMQSTVQKTMANAQELAEILRQTATESAELLGRRVQATMNDVQSKAKKD